MITDNCWNPAGQAISVRRKMERDGGSQLRRAKETGIGGKKLKNQCSVEPTRVKQGTQRGRKQQNVRRFCPLSIVASCLISALQNFRLSKCPLVS